MAATPRPGRITPAEAHTRTQAGEAVLLDVREETEHAAGHAPGGIWLPLGRLATGALLPEAVKGRPSEAGLDELAALARARLKRMQYQPGLFDGFIAETG